MHLKRTHCSSSARKLHKRNDGSTNKIRHLYIFPASSYIQTSSPNPSPASIFSPSPTFHQPYKEGSNCAIFVTRRLEKSQLWELCPAPAAGTVGDGRETSPARLCVCVCQMDLAPDECTSRHLWHTQVFKHISAETWTKAQKNLNKTLHFYCQSTVLQSHWADTLLLKWDFHT